jgi:transcriptional regulator with XRE-family HTH domain
MPSNGDLGRAIRRLRRARKLTIEALAHAADMHPTYAGRIERGGASPTFEKIVLLAQALDVSLPVLMHLAEDEAEVIRAMCEARARIARNH